MNKTFGSHLIIDASECEGELKKKSHIQKFIDTLVFDIGMEKKGETIFEYFENNEYNRERDIVGWSVVQIISLSSITIHINEISKSIYFDLFTCGQLNKQLVINIFNDFFNPSKIRKLVLTRDCNLPPFENFCI